LAKHAARNSTLDGLRGIAAIAVCAYHLTAKLNVPGILLIRGQIAVDFFFVLSGFVLGSVSERRLTSGQITPREFIIRRLVRFFPMSAAGVIVGGVIIALFGQERVVDHTVARPVLGMFLSLFWIPVSAGARLVFFPNNALWSLAGELIINIVFAFAAGIRLRWLVPIHLTLATAFAVLGFPGRYVGFGFQDIDLVLPTLLRVAVSFSAGVLVCRVRQRFGGASAINPVWLAALLVLPMLTPGGAAVWRSFFSLAYILVLFPLLVFLAADAKPLFARAGAALGDLSFPLYAVHLPIVAILAAALLPLPLWVRIVSAAVIVLFLSSVALFLDRYLDRPIRNVLGKIIETSRSSRTAHVVPEPVRSASSL
jgi:peptidoglycan/LPS O-acetylase OafA/YrhL